MKGPSSEAIKKFKLQLEQKKRDEYDRKVQGKLSTLKHRAAQGDKKAKQQLKIIEKEDQERSKPSEPQKSHVVSKERASLDAQSSSKSIGGSNTKCPASRPKKLETDFEELMKLAVNNKNEVKHEVVREKRTVDRNKLPRLPPNVHVADRGPALPALPQPGTQAKVIARKPSQPELRQISSSSHMQTTSGHLRRPQPSVSNCVRRPVISEPATAYQARPRLPVRRAYRDDDEYDAEEGDDDYESDGFVVHDEDDEVRDELDKTIRTMFRYDKRRCDLRERELDRQYRAIGRVSTFEDLEREERRASRLAAAEDARAFREEEERKRLKKMKLKGLKDS